MRRSRPAPAITEDGILVRQGADLPHWEREGATYAVTFRLADSLPASAVARFARERDAAREIPDAERRREKLIEIATREEAELDRSAGSRLLADPAHRRVVTDAIHHFAGARYALFAYVVMPNHVHALLRPHAPHRLTEILQSWKSFTAKRIGSGSVWQRESYDHLIRGDEDLLGQVAYLRANPERAGLRDGFSLWIASNLETLWNEAPRGIGVPPMRQAPASGNAIESGTGSVSESLLHRRDADATHDRGIGVPPMRQTSAASDITGVGTEPESGNLSHRRDADATGAGR